MVKNFLKETGQVKVICKVRLLIVLNTITIHCKKIFFIPNLADY